MIVPGNWGGSIYTDLLFYDSSAGEIQFYRTDDGQIQALHDIGNQRDSWYGIVPGQFAPGVYTDLLFHDQDAGLAELYRAR